MVPGSPVPSTNRKQWQALPDAHADDATDRPRKLLLVARAELTLVCSVACKVAAVLFVLEGLFWIATLADPLSPGVFAAAAAGPHGAVLQRVPIARGAN